MNIVFICSSLEPQHDGVGDYTRKLAGALNNCGWKACVIAFNDRHLKENAWQGTQRDEEKNVETLRLSANASWEFRVRRAKEFIDDFNPQWLSLQYVPFGYHLKGLPFNLGARLNRMATNKRWHIMFHELSVNRDKSLKFKLWSYLQVSIIRALIKQLRPAVISTNTEIYRQRLDGMGYKTRLLPLFSNIERAAVEHQPVFDTIIPPYILQHREDYTIGTLFGSFDFKSWDMRSLLDKFTYKCTPKRAVIASVGKMSSGDACWQQLKYDYPNILFLSLGVQSAAFISYWLSHYTDFGILTTFPKLSGKSGSFMAFKEHGIPVLCREPDARLKHYNMPLDDALTVVTSGPLQIPPKYAPVSLLRYTANRLIQFLETHA